VVRCSWPHPQRSTASAGQPGAKTGTADRWATHCCRFTHEPCSSSEALEYKTRPHSSGCSQPVLASRSVTVHSLGVWLSGRHASRGSWRRLGRTAVHTAQSTCLSRRGHETICAGLGDKSLVVEPVESAGHVPWHSQVRCLDQCYISSWLAGFDRARSIHNGVTAQAQNFWEPT